MYRHFQRWKHQFFLLGKMEKFCSLDYIYQLWWILWKTVQLLGGFHTRPFQFHWHSHGHLWQHWLLLDLRHIVWGHDNLGSNWIVQTFWYSGFLCKLHKSQGWKWCILSRPQDTGAASCKGSCHLKFVITFRSIELTTHPRVAILEAREELMIRGLGTQGLDKFVMSQWLTRMDKCLALP